MQAAFALLFVSAFLSIIQFSGCSSSGDNVSTPSSQTLSISASPTSVAADGSDFSVITATLTSKATALPANSITFTTSLGTLSASTADVNSGGDASVTLSSSSSGVATVRATFGSESASTTVTFGLGSIAISGTENVADGSTVVSETTTITFTVTDLNGDAVSGLTLTLDTPSTNSSDVTASFSNSSPSTNNSGVTTSVLTTSSADLGVDLTVTFTVSGSGVGSASGQVIFNDT